MPRILAAMLFTASATMTYAGKLIQTAGPASNAVPFDPTKVTRTEVGAATFSHGNAATFSYTVNHAS